MSERVHTSRRPRVEESRDGEGGDRPRVEQLEGHDCVHNDNSTKGQITGFLARYTQGGSLTSDCLEHRV